LESRIEIINENSIHLRLLNLVIPRLKMAPGNISKIARQPRAANVRAKVLERVAQMQEEEGEENQKKIKEYEELLKQKDEKLEF
jgi:pyruvate-formate lyase-activating enzyme